MDSSAPEIEDYTNRWFFHPISTRLARALSRTWVHPNMVSLAGVFFGVLAGISYYQYDQGNSALMGFFYMLVWHVLDGTDGQLARLTGKATAAGRAIDGLADHLVYLAVYLGLAFAIYDHGNPQIIWIVLVAGAAHALQASTLDRERQTYRFWVYSGLAGTKLEEAPIPKNFLLRGLHLYFHYTANLFASDKALKLQAYELKFGPPQREAASAYYKQHYVNYLHVWSLLSPNSHTVVIFIFAAIGFPLGYFLFEIIGMSFILVLLLIWKKRKDAAFSEFLASLAHQKKK